MVKVKQDLKGITYGRLTVIEQAEDYIDKRNIKASMWKCKCVCGNIVNVRGTYLKNGHTKSCGCLVKDTSRYMMKKINERHNIYELNGDYGICYDENKTWLCYFDKEDYDLIKFYTWSKERNWYAIGKDENNKVVYMHCLVMGKERGDVNTVDHINRLPFDNRKENLRICTLKQNLLNRKSYAKSGYRGVYKLKNYDKWCAYTSINGKKKHIGIYNTIEDAIKAREEVEKGTDIDIFGYEATQNIITYPNGAKKIYIPKKYMNIMLSYIVALCEMNKDDKKFIYGELVLIIDDILNRLK